MRESVVVQRSRQMDSRYANAYTLMRVNGALGLKLRRRR